MIKRLPGEVELLTRLQGHIGLANVVAAADGRPKALGLALGVEHRHALDFDLEHQFNSGLDLGLGGVLQHLESDGIGLLATIVAFSDTIGATSTAIRRPSWNEFRKAGVGFMRLMRTSP
jgi:hypothetical protein